MILDSPSCGSTISVQRPNESVRRGHLCYRTLPHLTSTRGTPLLTRRATFSLREPSPGELQ